MAQPTPYTPAYDFTDYQTSNPTAPLPADKIDAEFNALNTTTDEILVNLALIQRDDGALANAVVTPDAFTAASLLLMAGSWAPKGAWLTTTSYSVGDVVTSGGNSYVCATAHTSGTFATDLAAIKWMLVAAGTYTAASTTYDNATSGLTADDVQAAIDEVVVEVALKANTADLGDSATKDVGTTAGTVAAGDHTQAIAKGGTGATTATAGFDALAPTTTRGDIIRRGASANERLAVGAANTVLVSNGTDPVWSSAPLPRSFVAGCGLSNNSGDANNDIDIAAGVCRDSSNAANITVSALTKQLDAAWAAGTAAGGLDTGSKATSTWYHVYAISKAAGADPDVMFSVSAPSATWGYSGANLPTDYTLSAYLGSVVTDGSGNIRAFTQVRDRFYWSASVIDVNNQAMSTANRTLYPLTVPTGFKVMADFRLSVTGTSCIGIVTSPSETDQAPSGTGAGVDFATTAAADIGRMRAFVLTDSSGQIGVRAASAGNLFISTCGWNDLRGRAA